MTEALLVAAYGGLVATSRTAPGCPGVVERRHICAVDVEPPAILCPRCRLIVVNRRSSARPGGRAEET